MGRRILLVLLLLFQLMISVLAIFSAAPLADTQTECFSVPSSVFTSAVQSTIAEIRSALSLITKVAGKFGGFQVSNAIGDCVELLDFSSDELSWTISNNSKIIGTGNRRSDLRAWLSAAVGNQETCLEGFDGTNGAIKGLVSPSLSEVSTFIGRLLEMVRDQAPPHEAATATGGRRLVQRDFPEWITNKERRLLQSAVGAMQVDLTVAQDGTGNFTTVTDAVNASPDNGTRRYVIYVKRGMYKENVEIKKKKWNLILVGDGMGVTVISGNRSFIDGWTTFRSATFAVSGRGFIARDMSFENTAGPSKHQAVALRSDSDLSAFYRCGIHGYQDTLYAHSLRQFYRECRISGTVDFIFGNGAVVFQNCQILARKPLPGQKNSITAQGRKDPNQNTGFSLQFCNISADSDLAMSPNSTLTYLGRPWKQFSRTIIMQSYISNVVRAEGWLEWQGDFALDTLYYAEYMNYGPGAALGSRVKWQGYHALSDSKEANNFTVGQFIEGNLWLPATGVKYISGLIM